MEVTEFTLSDHDPVGVKVQSSDSLRALFQTQIVAIFAVNMNKRIL